MKKLLLSLILILLLTFTLVGDCSWVTPTGDNGAWGEDSLNARDNNTGTYAAHTISTQYAWNPFLELTHSGMWCDSVEFWANVIDGRIETVDVDVYYDGAWHDVWQGSFSDLAYTVKSLGGTYYITKFRFSFYNIYAGASSAYLHEVKFNTATPPVVIPTVTTQAVTDIDEITATGNGNITDTGEENCTKRGVCWNTTGSPTITDSKSEETGSFGTGAFTRSMTGLDPGVLYYVKAYAYNSAGYGYGSEVEFTTQSVWTHKWNGVTITKWNGITITIPLNTQ